MACIYCYMWFWTSFLCNLCILVDNQGSSVGRWQLLLYLSVCEWDFNMFCIVFCVRNAIFIQRVSEKFCNFPCYFSVVRKCGPFRILLLWMNVCILLLWDRVFIDVAGVILVSKQYVSDVYNSIYFASCLLDNSMFYLEAETCCSRAYVGYKTRIEALHFDGESTCPQKINSNATGGWRRNV
jgi:hypothetical protein